MASAAIDVIVGSHNQKLNAAAPPQQQFGAGRRLYGACPDKRGVGQVRDYVAGWGEGLDVYIPGGSGFRRGSYCFVTFDSFHCAHQAWAQAERRIGSQVSLSQVGCTPFCWDMQLTPLNVVAAIAIY